MNYDFNHITTYSKNIKNIIKKNVDGIIIPNLKINDHIFLLLDKDESYVAMIYFTIKDNKCFINYVHTNMLYRRQNLSSQLVQRVIDFCNKGGIKYIEVVILPDSGSNYVFAKNNFSYIDENVMHYYY